jgi:hypothetical protein
MPDCVRFTRQIDCNIMKRGFLPLLCIAVLCTILTLGLWPFHSPRNDVGWTGKEDGLHFGRHGVVVSSGSFASMASRSGPEGSLEIWLQPNHSWGSGTFLAFYSPGKPPQLSLCQSLTDLLLKAAISGDRDHVTVARTYVDNVFRKPRAVFITITTGSGGTHVYVDGLLVAARPGFPLTGGEFTGRLVLGDSIGQTDSWSGRLLGLAIYRRQLTAKQVFDNYTSWEQNGSPQIADAADSIALYLFNEHAGRVIKEKGGSDVDLYIAERYLVMDKIFLEPFWSEFNMSRSYWTAALKNIVGFIPFGFSFYAYLAMLLPGRRVGFITVILGTAVSFTIEILQAYLPTRESGTTDLITNTIGTWIGVASFRLLAPILVRFFPRLPFPRPHP